MKEVVRVYIGNPLENGNFNGTAFFVDPYTLITAKHVVSNIRDKGVYISDIPGGGILVIDEVELCDRDIAILRVKKSFDIDTFPFTNQITQGSNVNIIGFYDNFSSRKSYENRVIGYYNKEHTYELQNHLTNGLSGSPVLVNGVICGLAVSIHRNKNITYIIPISEVCMELKLVNLSINRSIEERQEEIENYIISNELSEAINLIVKFVADFSKNKNFRREALLYKSTLRSLVDENRKYGNNSDLARQQKQLSNSLLEFIEIIITDSKGRQ